MKKFDAWFSAQIRSVYYAETRRGTTPNARNRATWLVNRAQRRENALRQQIRQVRGVEPEELLRRKFNK